MCVKPIKNIYIYICKKSKFCLFSAHRHRISSQHIAHAWNYAEQMKPVGDPADQHHANMAGNIVKWWKHKILGGYKQFSGKIRLFFDFIFVHAYIYIYSYIYIYRQPKINTGIWDVLNLCACMTFFNGIMPAFLYAI